jgi:hypothetical protein
MDGSIRLRKGYAGFQVFQPSYAKKRLRRCLVLFVGAVHAAAEPVRLAARPPGEADRHASGRVPHNTCNYRSDVRDQYDRSESLPIFSIGASHTLPNCGFMGSGSLDDHISR